MRKLVFLVVLVLLLVGVFLGYKWLSSLDDPGFILLGINGWSLESTFVLFCLFLILAFVLFYVFFRFLGWLLKTPGRMKNKRNSIRFNRSQEALVAGLVDAAEGNWERAEKILIKHASSSGAPVLHYLNAARAAHSRGALVKRDEYLREAANLAGSDVVVGLTEAELNLAENEFDRAVETLTKLHSLHPTHATVLKLLHQAYKKAQNWEGLKKILPVLNEQKVLMEAEVKLLEIDVFGMQLKKSIASKSIDVIESEWREIPEPIKAVPSVASLYYSAMIELGEGGRLEADLVRLISSKWNSSLLDLFAAIESHDPGQQLSIAERWLPAHPQDAQLMRILGKLYFKQGQLLEAEQSLSKSIAQEASVEAYRVLGDVCYSQGDKDKAITCYKQALVLSDKSPERD